MKRYASIDIGTNTVRLLIAAEDYHSAKTPIIKKSVITRLGGGFGPSKNLAERSIGRTLKVLSEFAYLLDKSGVERLRAVATCVVRQARNRELFLKRVAEETGIPVEIIDSQQEARLTLKGVISVLKDVGPPILVFDIGGGSTEYILASSSSPIATSLDLGVVYLAESYLKSDPPTAQELALLENSIDTIIAPCKEDYLSRLTSPLTIVGCGGTITTLAAMDQEMASYDPNRINNYVLKAGRIAFIYSKLTSLPLKQRKGLPALEPGREDVIIPGCAIVLKTLTAFRCQELVVSDAGLLEGVLLDLIAAEG